MRAKGMGKIAAVLVCVLMAAQLVGCGELLEYKQQLAQIEQAHQSDDAPQLVALQAQQPGGGVLGDAENPMQSWQQAGELQCELWGGVNAAARIGRAVPTSWVLTEFYAYDYALLNPYMMSAGRDFFLLASENHGDLMSYWYNLPRTLYYGWAGALYSVRQDVLQLAGNDTTWMYLVTDALPEGETVPESGIRPASLTRYNPVTGASGTLVENVVSAYVTPWNPGQLLYVSSEGESLELRRRSLWDGSEETLFTEDGMEVYQTGEHSAYLASFAVEKDGLFLELHYAFGAGTSFVRLLALGADGTVLADSKQDTVQKGSYSFAADGSMVNELETTLQVGPALLAQDSRGYLYADAGESQVALAIHSSQVVMGAGGLMYVLHPGTGLFAFDGARLQKLNTTPLGLDGYAMVELTECDGTVYCVAVSETPESFVTVWELCGTAQNPGAMRQVVCISIEAEGQLGMGISYPYASSFGPLVQVTTNEGCGFMLDLRGKHIYTLNPTDALGIQVQAGWG